MENILVYLIFLSNEDLSKKKNTENLFDLLPPWLKILPEVKRWL
jgi:hypothetical protein